MKFKQTEIGPIPEEWEIRPLNELTVNVTDGKHGDCKNQKNSGYYFISCKDVIEGRVLYEGARQITQNDFLDSHKRTKLEIGDILLTNSGTIGRLAIAKDIQLTSKTTFQKSVAILKPDISRITSVFLYYQLLFQKNRLVEASGGTTQKNLLLKDIRSFLIFLPPLNKQSAITKILSDLDAKIELNRQMNEILESTAQALFKRWFLDDEMNLMPGKLGDVLDIIESGSRPKGGIDPNLMEGVPSIGAENINGIGFYDYSKTKFISPEFFGDMNRGIVKDYDVLIYKDGAYIGRKSMFGNGFPFKQCCVNEHVFILRANNRANQFVLYFLLNQEELKQLNTNSAQPGLNQESMKSLKIAIPNKAKADQFEGLVKPLIDKIFSNCNQSRALAQIRDSLLPKLMAGKLRVKVTQ